MSVPVIDYSKAACRDYNPEMWFVERGYSNKPAKAVCAECPIRQACLEMAMELEAGRCRSLRFGVYGGLSPDEREALDRSAVA